MKALRIALILVAAVFVMTGTSFAFHAGGVAECGGCHSMHTPASPSYLLVGSDQSSTCLSCHEHAGDTGPSSYHISTAAADAPVGIGPLQRTPGGDFGWLRKNYTFVVRGTTNTEAGNQHGHDINSADKGYGSGGTGTNNTIAPGGTFPQANLACNSCHDPHGRFRRNSAGVIAQPTVGVALQPIKTSGSYNGTGNEPTAAESVGVFRLLAGNGYTTKTYTPGFPGVPAAKVPSTYNLSEATNPVRVAYGVSTTNGGATWGQWCATCHPAMHSTGNIVHPIDQSMNNVNANYNAYVKTGDLSGSSTTSYTSLVPFAKNSGDYTVLAGIANNNGSNLVGPADGDQVMCLSCHREHASGNMFMLRWDQESTFITQAGAYPTGDAGRGKSPAEQLANYYDRPATVFATYQRGLCNKCHVKD